MRSWQFLKFVVGLLFALREIAGLVSGGRHGLLVAFWTPRRRRFEERGTVIPNVSVMKLIICLIG
jgi:hypothetical protein